MALAFAAAPHAVLAQSAAPVKISIAAQPLDKALLQFGQQTRLQVYFLPEAVRDLKAPAVSGSLTAQQALDRLLAGSGLAARIEGNTAVIAPAPAETATLSAVPVYGDGRAKPLSRAWSRAAAQHGTKTDTPLNEIPQTINVVTAQQLEMTGATDINQALRYIPGFSSYGSENRSDWYSVLRGFTPTAYAWTGCRCPRP